MFQYVSSGKAILAVNQRTQSLQTSAHYFHAECIVGIVEITMSTCGSNGSNPNVTNATYTCEAGYYKAPGPDFCKGVVKAECSSPLHTYFNIVELNAFCFTVRVYHINSSWLQLHTYDRMHPERCTDVIRDVRPQRYRPVRLRPQLHVRAGLLHCGRSRVLPTYVSTPHPPQQPDEWIVLACLHHQRPQS
jgi:hypothetical protein